MADHLTEDIAGVLNFVSPGVSRSNEVENGKLVALVYPGVRLGSRW